MRVVLRGTEKDANIERQVNELFNRAGRIRKIRRIKKVKSWLKKKLKIKKKES